MEISLWSDQHAVGNGIQQKRVGENQLVSGSDQKCELCSGEACCKLGHQKLGIQPTQNI